MSKKDIILEVFNLSHIYESISSSIEVFKNVSFKISRGEMVGLMGPSGSGKSTILNNIGLLDKPSSGEIKILGQDCSFADEYQRTKIRLTQIGFIFQSHRLFPEFSSLENVVIPQLIRGRKSEYAYNNAKKILTNLGLEHRFNHRPATLSGGEAQRVAIARALSNSPSLLVADEPTGNLDINSSKVVFEMLHEIVKQTNLCCIIATHNENLASKLDKVFSIQNKTLKLLK